MTITKNTNDIVIERIFNAPIKLVWRAWTEPEHFMKWWGPKTFTCPIARMDLRVGGKYFWAMQSPDGFIGYNTGEFVIVDPMTTLAFTNHFADEHGNVVPPTYYGMPGEDSDNVTTTIILEDLGEKTRMTFRHTVLEVDEHTENEKLGWNESLDKLAESL